MIWVLYNQNVNKMIKQSHGSENVQWVKVLHSEDGFKTNLASIALKDKGVDNVIMSKKDSTHVMIGFFELYVPQTLVVKAKRYLKELES